jgi:hypothetical protein
MASMGLGASDHGGTGRSFCVARSDHADRGDDDQGAGGPTDQSGPKPAARVPTVHSHFHHVKGYDSGKQIHDICGALVASSHIRDPPDRRGADVETDRSMAFGDRDAAGLGPVATRCNLAAFRGSAKV